MTSSLFTGTGELQFQDFCGLAAKFLTEEEDDEAIIKELREAFRLYDKEGLQIFTHSIKKTILLEKILRYR